MSASKDAALAPLVEALIAQGQPLALVETCTGGALAAAISAQAGASRVLRWGLTLYDHASKSRFLGLEPQVFIEHGSVSGEAVAAMAGAALDLLRASLETDSERAAARALAISGIAGPDGGRPGKPVGTCWMALADAQGVEARCFRLTRPGQSSRSTYRERAALTALDWLLGVRAHVTKSGTVLPQAASKFTT